jgi:predicted enzyme related to lactoylglutathione lyase
MNDAGAVLYAKDMRCLAAFYSAVAGLTEVQRGHDFTVLENGATQLTIVAVPERIATKIGITVPPRRREETPVKLFFAVPHLDAIRETVVKLGGALDPAGREWQFGGWRVCDGHDPEGNVFQLREASAEARNGELLAVAPVLRVAELGRSLAHYRDCLGFAVEFVYEDAYAAVARDGCRIHLKCAPPAERDLAAFEAAEHLDACFTVRDARGLSARFAEAGVGFSVPLRVMPYGTEFYVRDPDGYILGFVEPALA